MFLSSGWSSFFPFTSLSLKKKKIVRTYVFFYTNILNTPDLPCWVGGIHQFFFLCPFQMSKYNWEYTKKKNWWRTESEYWLSMSSLVVLMTQLDDTNCFFFHIEIIHAKNKIKWMTPHLIGVDHLSVHFNERTFDIFYLYVCWQTPIIHCRELIKAVRLIYFIHSQ